MCGFAGEYLLRTHERVSSDRLKQRAAALQHRGPDAIGTWLGGHVGITHVRLQLLDPLHGTQPMSSERGTVLSFNGEIYNNRELRAELSAYGFCFKTYSDTEVLLAAYETWGEKAWLRLNGMFAFALYDPAQEKLFLVRDRLGIKPLFYRFTGQGVEFGSEPSAWPLEFRGEHALHPSAVIHFLRYAHLSYGSQSLFTDLKSLEPGTQLVVDHHGGTLERWHLPAIGEGIDAPDHVTRAKLRYLLQASVQRQMTADAPVGIFLSGGVDSSILAGLFSGLADGELHSYTIALEGDREECSLAAAVAKRFGYIHHEVIVTPARFFSAMRELILLRAVPCAYPNEVLIYILAQEAAGNVKAVLTGEGADELFGGYTRILSILDLYARAQAAAQRGNPLLFSALKSEHPQLDFRSNLRFLAAAYSWFSASDLDQLFNRSWRDSLHRFEKNEPFDNSASRLDHCPADQFPYLWLEFTHLPNLLARLDGATMGASLEGRVPYTDYDLIDFSLRLPASKKYSPHQIDKPLLRAAFSDLIPNEVLNRPKRAFNASLNVLFASQEGRREVSELSTCKPMLELFDRNMLDSWSTQNMTPYKLNQVWLMVSFKMWINRNIL